MSAQPCGQVLPCGQAFPVPGSTLVVSFVVQVPASFPAGLQPWLGRVPQQPWAPFAPDVPQTVRAPEPEPVAGPGRPAARPAPVAAGLVQARPASAAPEVQVTGFDAEPAEAGAPLLPGSVWRLSREERGCRQVQEALEAASSDEERATIASELRGRVWQAMRHRNANHVLQKCVMTMRPAALQFIVDELAEKGEKAVTGAARHAFGCRILQRLLEHCSSDQLRGLSEGLLKDAVLLTKHMYGNYVVQHLLEFGTARQRGRLLALLEQHAEQLGRDVHSGAVLAKALAYGEPEERASLARALVAAGGVLAAAAQTRHGSLAAKLVLAALAGDELEEAVAQLRCAIPQLSANRYGRSVAALLGKGAPAEAPALGGA